VVRMIVRQGAGMTVLGVALGLVAAAAVSGVVQTLLYGVDATSPAAYLGVGLALGLVAMAATALPAHRAASIDPVGSLRSE
jgi:ABC-type antimicrobial peptide transport system permease subunit